MLRQEGQLLPEEWLGVEWLWESAEQALMLLPEEWLGVEWLWESAEQALWVWGWPSVWEDFPPEIRMIPIYNWYMSCFVPRGILPEWFHLKNKRFLLVNLSCIVCSHLHHNRYPHNRLRHKAFLRLDN